MALSACGSDGSSGNSSLFGDEGEETENNLEVGSGGRTGRLGDWGHETRAAQISIDLAARPERAPSNRGSRCVCRRYVTAFSASHWTNPSNHVIPAYSINKGKETGVVRHFVDAGWVIGRVGAGRRGAEEPAEGVWI